MNTTKRWLRCEDCWMARRGMSRSFKRGYQNTLSKQALLALNQLESFTWLHITPTSSRAIRASSRVSFWRFSIRAWEEMMKVQKELVLLQHLMLTPRKALKIKRRLCTMKLCCTLPTSKGASIAWIWAGSAHCSPCPSKRKKSRTFFWSHSSSTPTAPSSRHHHLRRTFALTAQSKLSNGPIPQLDFKQRALSACRLPSSPIKNRWARTPTARWRPSSPGKTLCSRGRSICWDRSWGGRLRR